MTASARLPRALIDRVATAAVHVRRPAAERAAAATRWPRRCWPTASTSWRRSVYSAGRAASSPPAPRSRTRSCRSTAPCSEPLVRATTRRARATGLVARGPRARAADRRSRRRGRSTTSATRTATCWSSAAGRPGSWPRSRPTRGARVMLVDDDRAGGSLLDPAHARRTRPSGPRDAGRADRPRCACCATRRRSAIYDDEPASWSPHGHARRPRSRPRQRVWHIRARQRRARHRRHERPIVFADNDRPGIMLAGAARTYVNRYGVAPGRRAVVFTTNDSAYGAALDLAAAGVDVAAIVDARRSRRPSAPHAAPASRCCRPGGRRHRDGASRRSQRAIAAPARRGARAIACDLLAVSGGFNPVVAPVSAASRSTGTRLRLDERHAGLAVAGPRPGPHGACWPSARPRGGDAVGDAPSSAWTVAAPQRGVERLARARRRPGTRHFVDLARDATVADIAPRASAPACARSSTSSATPRPAPAPTRARRRGVLPSAIAAACSASRSPRSAPPPSGRRSCRSVRRARRPRPRRPATTRSGRRRSTTGTSRTARCSRTSASGSGRGTTRSPARTWTPRCCASAAPRARRGRHGRLDARQDRRPGPGRRRVPRSPLHEHARLARRSAPSATALMCRADGMVFDDGVAIRLADDRFLTTTTTATPPPCSTGWRSGCRPSGRSCACG